MRRICQNPLRLRPRFRQLCVVVAGLLLATPAFAQGTSPWENAVNVLQQAFTSTIARGLGVQQKLMRHANISTTMNVYGGAFMKAKRKANTSVVQRVLLQGQTK